MKVKLNDIIEAIELTDQFSEFFLDMKTGEIVCVNDEVMTGEETEKIYDRFYEHGFCSLPSSFDIREYSIMEDFVETLSGMAYSRLASAIRGRGAFSRFRDGLCQMGIERQWFDFRTAACKQLAIEWCEGNGIEYDE